MAFDSEGGNTQERRDFLGSEPGFYHIAYFDLPGGQFEERV
jgi:hypothetical protein